MSSLTLKSRVKAYVQSMPAVWGSYWRIKQELLRIWTLRFFAHDIAGTYRAMFWVPGSANYRTLSASLLFQYHKLEKGLVMPGPRRLFGIEPAISVVQHLRRWREAGHPVSDPIYLGAIETLTAYTAHLRRHGLDPHNLIVPQVAALLGQFTETAPGLSTPVPLQRDASGAGMAAFSALAQQRRSVREFLPDPVPQAVIESAVALAQLSPSACNRQPCRVYTLTEPELKKAALLQQNGNRGFGHLAPHVLIITANEGGFFDASERHQPYIDGGLFAMSLCFGFVAQGVATCCLNWCVPPRNDRTVHRLVGIPASERIVMFMAIGYPPPDCKVPRSPRRALATVLPAVCDQSAHTGAPSKPTTP